MTDASLPALSSPSDAVPPLSVMDCATEEETLQSTSNMTDSSQSSGSGLGVPFCDITDPQLLKHCNSDMLESPECVKLKEIPYSNDIGGSTTGVQNVAFNLSNQKLLDEIPSLKTSPSSQENLCSSKAFSAKIHAGETTEAHLDVGSSVEVNHLQLPVLPKLDASSNSSVVDVDLLDKLMAPTDQLPVSVETKEDPLSLDSSTSTKSSNSLSCDEASSKDSLLTSTESKSMGSPPETELMHSAEVKELYDASKTERIEPECNKSKVSLLSAADCVKPFATVSDETDSGCPSDSDGLALQSASEEANTQRIATRNKVIVDAPSDSLVSGILGDINFSSASNPAMSSNRLNLGTSASTSDGSHKCDTSEKTMEGRISSSSVAVTDTHQNVNEIIVMQDVTPLKSENDEFCSHGRVEASSALGSAGDASMSGGSPLDAQSFTKESSESTEEKSLLGKRDERLSGCQARSSVHCGASGTPMESLPLSNSDSGDMISESVHLADAGSGKNTDAGSIPRECDVSIIKNADKHGNDIDAITKGAFLEGLKSDEVMEVAPSLNVTVEDKCKVKNPTSCLTECNLFSVEKCIPNSAAESLSNVCNEMPAGCVNTKSSCTIEVGQLLDTASGTSSNDVKTVDVPRQFRADTSSPNCGPDASTGTLESCDTSGKNNMADSTRMDCSVDSSINKSVNPATPLTGDSMDITKELGGALRSSASLITGPAKDAEVLECKSESLIASEASAKALVSTEALSAGAIESENKMKTSALGKEASGFKFANEFCAAIVDLPNEIQSSGTKSSGKVSPTNRILNPHEFVTANEDSSIVEAKPSCTTAETSIMPGKTTGQILKVEHPESLEEECLSVDGTNMNLNPTLKSSEHSDLTKRDPLGAVAGGLEVDAKVRLEGVGQLTSPKQNVSGGKIFPSIDSSCDAGDVVLQTVVGGVLQTLDVAALEARKREEEDVDHRKLFAGVDDELACVGDALSRNTAMHVLENNAGETDGIGGLVINSVVGAFGEGVDEYVESESATEADPSNKQLADISSSYHGMNKNIDAQQPECEDMPKSKRPRLESVEPEVRRSVVLRVKPVKGKLESFWDSPKLRTALAEKGTVLLRLCTTEPTEEHDVPADFVGVMLECCEDAAYSGHAADRPAGPEVYSVGVDGGYHPGIYNHYGYLTRPPVGGDEDFVETEEVEESMDYDGASQTLDWQGSGCPSVEPSTEVTSRNIDVEDNSHEITYHDEGLHGAERYAGHDELYFESEIEEKEKQYEKHKHLVEQQRIASLRIPARICPECNKGFSKRKQFEKHLKTHRPLLQCRYCSFKSRSKKLHKNHEMRHQKDDPQFACTICSMKFVESSLFRGHMSRQHGIFYCPRCCHQAASFDERNEHMMAEHGVQIKRKLGLYTVRECGDGDDDDDDNDTTEQQNACRMCLKKCRSRALLRIHVAQHYNVDPNQLSDGLEPIEKNEHMVSEVYSEESSEGYEDCKVAYTPSRLKKKFSETTEERFTDKAARLNREDDPYRRCINDPEVNVLARIKPASENAIYRCADCDKDFPNPTSLFMHAVVTHGFLEYDARRRAKEAELISCPISTSNVQEGEQAQPANTSEKAVTKLTSCTANRQFIPYFCRICGPETKFSKYSMYIAHMKTHRKMRKCPACNFQSRLAMRVLIHQMNSHKRMLRCPRKCLQLFQTKEELDAHKSEVDCKADTQ